MSFVLKVPPDSPLANLAGSKVKMSEAINRINVADKWTGRPAKKRHLRAAWKVMA